MSITSPILRYAIALVSVAIATGIRATASGYLGDRHPLALAYLALILTVSVAGDGPGVVALVASVVAADVFGGGLYHGISQGEPAVLFGNAYFVAVGIAIIALGRSTRLAWERARQDEASLRALARDLERHVEDRTEQLRVANERLAVSERRLAGVFESAMDAILLIGDDERIAMANPAAAAMLGVQAADVIGRPFEELIPTRVRESHRANAQAFATQGDNSRRMGERGNISVMRPDGSEFPVEVAISRVEVDGRRFLTLVLRDISERLAAQRELQASKTQLEAALAAGGLATWFTDFSTRRLYWDDAYLAMWGRTREEFGDGRFDTVLQWVHPDDREVIGAAIEAAPERLGPHHAEFRIIRPDGTLRWLRTHGQLHRDDAGVSRFHGVASDITRSKQAEDERLRSQKLESLGTLAGGIAHDFNNILLAISGNTFLAQDHLPSGHPAHQYLDEITRATERAAQVSRRILAFSRPRDAERRLVAVESVVEEALGLLRATVPSRIDITTRFAPGVPRIVADAGQLHQVVVNITTNAAYAIASAGTIHFDVDRATEMPGEAGPAAGGAARSYARLSVSDSGCGMDAATTARMFDPFFTTKPLGTGTGLGLSVVHGIVKAMGGSIAVDSQPGVGTTISLYFPAAGPGPGSSATADAPAELPPPLVGGRLPPARTPGRRVLYVDDEPGLVGVAQSALARGGYEVTGFCNPVEALAAFVAHPDDFDVVVTDLSMPVLPGFELVAKIRERRGDVPVFLTSGFVQEDDERRAAALGVRAILPKPHTLRVLLPALDELFAAADSDPKAPVPPGAS